MRKLLLVVVAAASVVVVSCSKKEGAIATRTKIDCVTVEENIYHGDRLYYTSSEYVSEQWNWDGSEMYRIDYGGNDPYSENFFYDCRSRIVRTTVPAYVLRSDFFYDGRQLVRIETYKGDSLYITSLFNHDDDELVSIDIYYHNADTAVLAAVPLATLLGRDLASLVAREGALALSRQGKGAGDIHVGYQLTWTDGNVTHLVVTDATGEKDIAVTYDDKSNPYHQLLGYRETYSTLFGYRTLSENNITSITMPYGIHGDVTFRYTYEYDGKMPVARTLKYKYMAMEEVLWDSVLVVNEIKERINYKD